MPTYSHSRIESFEKCPKAFHYKYVQGEEERFSTIEQQMGSAVHAALEWAYENRKEGTPSKSSVLEKYRTSFLDSQGNEVRVIKRGLTKADYLQEGESMLEEYLSGPFSRDDSATLALECEFQISLRDGVQYRGFVDRVARDSNGTLVLLDYKTGKRVPNPTQSRQLRSYSLWAFEQFEDDAVRLVFEDLRGQQQLAGQVTRPEAARISADLTEDIRRIESASGFPASASHLCRWCGFCPICPDAHAAVPRSWREVEALREEEDGDICPRCGGFLEERSGRRGPFLGCSEFPSCRYSRDL